MVLVDLEAEMDLGSPIEKMKLDHLHSILVFDQLCEVAVADYSKVGQVNEETRLTKSTLKFTGALPPAFGYLGGVVSWGAGCWGCNC